MADKMNIFVDTARNTYDIAEAKLRVKGINQRDIKDAFEEMKMLAEPVLKRYLSCQQIGLKHIVGYLCPLVQRQVMCWIKQFLRWMYLRCAVKHPWQVILEDRLPIELFNILESLVSCTNFGLITVKTRKNCVYAFTKERSVRKVFNDLTDHQLGKENFSARKIKGDKLSEAIICEEKLLWVKYSYEKEIIAIDFNYRFWNEHGWLQHQ